MRLRCGAVGPGAINDGGVPARCTLGALVNPWENNYPSTGTRLGADLRQFFFFFLFLGDNSSPGQDFSLYLEALRTTDYETKG